MSRFNEVDKRDDLNFDYNLYDAVRFDDNRTALITNFGIYDNQYWCEVCYPNGVHLGAADYFSSNPKFYKPIIIGKVEEVERINIIKEYIEALKRYTELYSEHIEKIKSLL